MITRPVDHGLHVIQSCEFNHHPAYTWLAKFILKSYMPQFHLSRHRYKLFFVLPYCHYNLISLLPTWPSISTSFFWSRSLICRIWVKTVRFDRRLAKTTCRPTPFQSSGGGVRGNSSRFTKKSHWEESQVKW